MFSTISKTITQNEFEQRAEELRKQGFTHMPLVQETLADLDTPVSTYLKLANTGYTYLFESVQGGDKWGRYSIIGLPCDKVFKIFGNEFIVEIDGDVIERRQVDEPLQMVRELLSQYKVAEIDDVPEMIGGLVGYFGYETIGYIEAKLANQNKPDELGCPDILLMESKNILVFDNLLGKMSLVTIVDLTEENAYLNAQNRITEWVDRLAQSFKAPEPAQLADNSPEDDYEVYFPKEDFESAVEKCRDYIRDGDIMQVVLSQRLSTPFDGRPFDLYRALRTINPSPYMYYLNFGDFDVVGSSPEILVRLQEEVVTVRPIAGTRKRGVDEATDLALEQELLNDEKELAEHLMLDLGRNDVGRIAQTGSVELTENMNIERYSHVMHIVSNVDGKIRSNYDSIDVLKATFPAGTVSGAPKIRAMQIINELEPVKRGVYSGAIGYLGWNGNMDMAIAIRTAVIRDETLYIQAGAGIVADSIPKYEWKETMNKARAVFSAVEMTNRGLKVS